MKRITLILALLFIISASLPAQAPTQRMKMIHMAAVRIADKIGVPDASKDDFVKLYQDFKRESSALLESQVISSGDKEAALEAKILSDFDKSEKLLALRKEFYFKFRKILSPSQIQSMYDLEKEHNATKR